MQQLQINRKDDININALICLRTFLINATMSLCFVFPCHVFLSRYIEELYTLFTLFMAPSICVTRPISLLPKKKNLNCLIYRCVMLTALLKLQIGSHILFSFFLFSFVFATFISMICLCVLNSTPAVHSPHKNFYY